MSSELIGILGVGVALLSVAVALAGLFVTSFRGVRNELGKLRDEVNEGLALIDARLSTLENQQAKLEGLLEGLREVVFGWRPA